MTSRSQDKLLGKVTRLIVPEYRPKRAPTKMVAIVIPSPGRRSLTADERISLRHLQYFLKAYDKFLLVPRGEAIAFDGIISKEIPRKYFGSPQAHSRMTYSPRFFHSFEDYRYLLIYHLDALVFRDELLKWCETGIDYVGAPWLPCDDMPWIVEPGVGNGGFCLINVRSALEVLYNRHRVEPSRFWEDVTADGVHLALAIPRYLKRFQMMQANRIQKMGQRLKDLAATEATTVTNDQFWAYRASTFKRDFKKPDWLTALRFAFECAPRKCFELNGSHLPFGCHAWPRYDRAFWEPHLLR